MKSIIYIAFLLGFSYLSAQVGIPTSTPQGILDLNNDNGDQNLGLVLPKGELVDFQNVTSGTLIYDLTNQCVRVKGTSEWGECLPSTQELIADGNCFMYKGLQYCIEGVNGFFWLDRSLGSTTLAGQNAWFFQFGRSDDGHQISNSSSVDYNSLATKPISPFETNTAYSGKFISNATGPHWMFPEIEMKNSWSSQRAHLTNNPCPKGFGIPSSQQFIYYLQTKGYGNVSRKGLRSKGSSAITNSNEGYYWVNDTTSKKFTHMAIKTTAGNTYELIENSDANALNVKCIKIN